MIIKRILFLIIGAACIYGVVALGIQAQYNQIYILWFGLASALLAPIGLASIGYGISLPERQTIEKLAKLPEIERLLSEANSVEEKKSVLEQERKNLTRIVEFESRKQALYARRSSLENEGVRVIKELEVIDNELNRIENHFESSLAKDEIIRLQKRIKAKMEGDIVLEFGDHYLILEHKMFDLLPYGRFIFSVLSLFHEFAYNSSRIKNQKRDKV